MDQPSSAGAESRLFVYGTLGPGRSNETQLTRLGGRYLPASVRGRRLAPGWGRGVAYPGIELDDAGGDVRGHVFESEALGDSWAALDRFEGDDYRRVPVTARLESGEAVEAYVYASRVAEPEPALSLEEFLCVDLRVGRIVEARVFEAARKPAYVLQVDFGPELGVKKSSAQLTEHYDPETLVGRLVVGVVNFPPKQIGPLRSECLVTGFHDEQGSVKLCVPDGEVPLGARLL